jgi:uncharacterized protein YutE (UPF0331/DUF86 family)
MVRTEFVKRKLALISDDLARLLHFKSMSFSEIASDFVNLAAVERLLERIVMRAIDINEHLIAELPTDKEHTIAGLTYRDTFLWLADLGVYSKSFAESIARSAGLRNILVHDYNDTDLQILYQSIHSCLEDYHAYVCSVSDFLVQLKS